MSSGERLRTAVLQHDAALKGPGERFDWLAGRARELTGDGIDLIVCPELYMSGYDVGDDLIRFGEPADGPFAGKVATLARETGAAIVYGYPEKAGEVLYNSALCIDADGATLANHRKSVLPPSMETRYFQRGDALTLVTVKSVRVALVICYEIEFPETIRNVAMAGAEVVVAPTALVRQWDQVAERVIPARAFENGVYVLYANHAGREGELDYLGGSCIVSPTGRDLARAGDGEEVLTATLEIDAVHAAQARLPYLKVCGDIPTRQWTK